MSVPNFISLARLIAAPLIVYLLIQAEHEAALALFIVAGLSDAVDGYLAKRLNQTSRIGSYLDPLADKVLLIGVYVAFGYQGYLPHWLVILVVFRDGMILGGALLSLSVAPATPARPLLVSKINTLCQIVLIAVVLTDLAFAFGLEGGRAILVYVVAASTIASGAAYLIGWVEQMSRLEDAK